MSDAEYLADRITVFGAREHNLRDISLDIPHNCLVVVTGLSGSGKSTLAFDLLYAEGQRRFLDSTSAYARQFVRQLPRPEVDCIRGLPPTVGIEQRNSRGGGKSTVGTVTEIHQFLRLLYARLGVQHCPDCGLPVEPQTLDRLAEILIEQLPQRGDLTLFAPLIRQRKGYHSALAAWAESRGYSRLRADGALYDIAQPFRLDRYRDHDVEVEIGTVTGTMDLQAVRELVGEAIGIGKGVIYAVAPDGHQTVHSTLRACPSCLRSFETPDPKGFSYNSSRGWCPDCRGFGEMFRTRNQYDVGLDEQIEETWFRWSAGKRKLCHACQGSRLNRDACSVFLYRQRYSDRKTGDEDGLTIDQLSRMTVKEAQIYFDGFGEGSSSTAAGGRPDSLEAGILRDILPEIRERLWFLTEAGLDYLQLERGVTTLSGGENQRIRLASQLGSNLSGALFVLDEPTIGLHSRDNARLLTILRRLKSKGNSLIVVEHDEDTISQADYVIDLGPGAGSGGGTVVYEGTVPQLLASGDSLTARCMQSRRQFPLRGKRRKVSPRTMSSGKESWLHLAGANTNNLKNLQVSIPLGRLVAVTGVSGAGKSTLMRECMLPALEGVTGQSSGSASTDEELPEVTISGLNLSRNISTGHDRWLGRVQEINQSPIGRTPRSIPATYVGVFDRIRQVFAQLPESRIRGYGPGRFSFNSNQGQCPNCRGAGVVKLEMSFLPPTFVPCESCGGARYSTETLVVKYRGKNIADILELSVAEAKDFFDSFAAIGRAFAAMVDAGLGYLRLGQTSPTLSGGEAQRLKLVTRLLSGLGNGKALEDKSRKVNVFLLEEPSIGLHTADVHQLLQVLQRLVDQGHSVLVIEHNLDIVAEADWVIDLGPEGGDAGGRIVACGTPERIARRKHSHTGKALKAFLAES